ncbi:MAG: DUF72 domain-containing protein [Steroidobacteraceae bacterium]
MNVARRSTRVYVGVGGWSYERWREEFYPEDLTRKRELEYASRKFTSIEINSTFHGLQKPATFARWREATPANFVFAVKAPRFVTNRRLLASAGEAIERFLGSGLLELKDKLGPINWQLAPGKQFDADDIEAFFRYLPKSLRHAIEVRHPSFNDPRFIALARKHSVAIVLAGDSDYPSIDVRTAPFIYARIMGTKKSPRTGYAKPALDAWASRIGRWRADESVRDIFFYVISGFKAHNPAAAMALLERM